MIIPLTIIFLMRKHRLSFSHLIRVIKFTKTNLFTELFIFLIFTIMQTSSKIYTLTLNKIPMSYIIYSFDP